MLRRRCTSRSPWPALSSALSPGTGPLLLLLLGACLAPLQISAERTPAEAAEPVPLETAAPALPTPTATTAPTAVPTRDAAPLPRAPVTIHTVETGDSLWRIAERYGVQAGDLERDNGLLEADLIRPGDRLLVRLHGPGLERAPLARRAPVSRGADVDALLRRAEQRLGDAYYEEALASAERGLAALDAGGARSGPKRARLEMVAGTAQLALGNQEAALERFALALQAQPQLRPDPQRTSPKVLRTLETARARRAAGVRAE